MIKRIFFILILIGFAGKAFAIGDDSTVHRYNPFWTKFYRLNDWRYYTVIDTTLNRFEVYNPSLKMYDGRHVGNLGSPYYKLSAMPERGVGLDVGIHAYDPYLLFAETNLFYRTQRPFTSLSYVMGAKDEQYFFGTHTQNVTEQYNFGINFKVLGSQGNFKNQKTSYFNLNLSQSFTSRNERYHADLTTFYNKAKVQLNGGIAVPQDSVYNSSRYFANNIVPVKLDSARYGYKEYHATLQHSYGWGHTYDKKINDSTVKKIFTPAVQLQHRFDYQFVRHTYNDDSTDFDFYPEVRKNIYKSYDTIKYHAVTNELRLKLLGEKYKDDTVTKYRAVAGSIFAKHTHYSFISGNYDDIEDGVIGLELKKGRNWSYSGKGSNEILKEMMWNVNAEYAVLGRNKGDYFAEGELYAYLKNFYAKPLAGLSKHHSSLLQQSFSGNYYSWNNSFDAQNNNWVGVSLGHVGKQFSSNNFELGYTHVNYSNPVYYGYSLAPQQFDGTVAADIISLKLNLGLGKFHLDNNLVYQRYNKDVYHLPEFYSTHSIYFAGFLFKNALQLRTGFNVNYNTAYYADAFDPSTSQFYLQNQTKTGDYVMADAFLDMKIKTVRISIQMMNALQGLVGDGVQTAPGYLMPDRALKVYLNWMFWN